MQLPWRILRVDPQAPHRTPRRDTGLTARLARYTKLRNLTMALGILLNLFQMPFLLVSIVEI